MTISTFPRSADSAPAAAAPSNSAVELVESAAGASGESDETKIDLERMSVDQLLHLIHRVLKLRRRELEAHERHELPSSKSKEALREWLETLGASVSARASGSARRKRGIHCYMLRNGKIIC